MSDTLRKFISNLTIQESAVVDVQTVKPTKLNNLEKTEKCPRTEFIKAEEICLPREEGEFASTPLKQDGMKTEKEPEVCAEHDFSQEYTTEDTDSSSESQKMMANGRIAEAIKKNLSWIRWTEYSPYAKDLIKSSKWESIQNELISVVSYNVLSQILLEKHDYLYKRHDVRSLKWNTRSQVLLDEFADLNADILCLQEVDSSLLKSFYNYNLNRLGYQGIYKQRTNDKLDGCAIYFKKKKFNLVKQMTVELFKQSVHLLDRDNIGIILKLSVKSNPEVELIVATTHLLYNPKRGDIKLAQTQLILAEIEKMAYIKHNPLTLQPEYLPIIFAGDMNYSPENGNKIRGSTLTAIIQILETLREAYGIDTNNQRVYQLVTKSFLEYEGMSSEQLQPTMRGHILNKTLLPPKMGVTDSCQYASSLSSREGKSQASFSTGSLDHHLNLASVYDHVKCNLPEATTNQNRWVTVDYIFYSQLWDENLKLKTEGNLKLVSRLTLPNSREAEIYLKNIPNFACASDHLPLLATFHLKGNR